MKTFAKQVYRSFQIGAGADVALVEAGMDPKIIFNFGKYTDVLSMDSAVNQIDYKKQRSFIGRIFITYYVHQALSIAAVLLINPLLNISWCF